MNYEAIAGECLNQMGIAFEDGNGYKMLQREIAAILRAHFPEPAPAEQGEGALREALETLGQSEGKEAQYAAHPRNSDRRRDIPYNKPSRCEIWRELVAAETHTGSGRAFIHGASRRILASRSTAGA